MKIVAETALLRKYRSQENSAVSLFKLSGSFRGENSQAANKSNCVVLISDPGKEMSRV